LFNFNIHAYYVLVGQNNINNINFICKKYKQVKTDLKKAIQI